MNASALENVCQRIRANGIEESWRERAEARLHSLTKPPGSLGRLEDIAAQFVAAREEAEPALQHPAVYVFAADHGVASEGVSAYPAEVTAQMVHNFLAGGAAVNVLARAAAMDVLVVDVGVDGDLAECDGLTHRKMRRGTRNFALEPAMTEDEMFSAVQVGFEQAAGVLAAERNLIIAGEMGIGNTTAAAAITAALTAASAGAVTGAGTGLGAEGVARKRAVVERALQRHFGRDRAIAAHPLQILRCVGGFEIAAMAGLILKAASERIMVVLDGFISSAAGAIAFALEPAIKPFLFAGHQSTEMGHAKLLHYMGLEPILSLEMRLGEGTGAVLSTFVIKAALKLYNEMATFDSAGVAGPDIAGPKT